MNLDPKTLKSPKLGTARKVKSDAEPITLCNHWTGAPLMEQTFIVSGMSEKNKKPRQANSDAEMPIVSDDSLGVDTGTQLGLLLK